MSAHDKPAERAEARGAGPGDDDVAIIGMACRYPGADDPETYWQNQMQGRIGIREVPPDRWDWREFHGDPREPNRTQVKWGGFIDDVDRFDNDLFRISPAEARLMDPQQRLMLELTWSCLEDAGYVPASLAGSNTGVYVGVGTLDYRERLTAHVPVVEAYRSTGNYITMLPNRVSYVLDLHGPSLAFDTSCSSSLYAVHFAAQAIRRGEIGMAVVGGIALLLSHITMVAYAKNGMLSPTGQCRTFDAGANGYVRGEGGGVILLKKLRDALRDGDRVLGVIKGSAINHGGKAQTLTSPNTYAQSQVIQDAYENAGVPIDRVSYVEAHGTATPKGDPIEIVGLKRAWRNLERSFSVRVAPQSCGLGSVKTNIGHLEAAAGMAGLIKLLLAFRHRRLPALANFERLNPQIQLDDSPFFLVTEPRDWVPERPDAPLTAGLSSFGFGGTNAHVVLQSLPDHLRTVG